MKRTLALMGIGLIIFLGAMLLTTENVLEVVTVEKEVEVTPDWASDEEAVKAAQDVIQRKEWEAELNAVRSEIEALEARETELEKNLGTY